MSPDTGSSPLTRGKRRVWPEGQPRSGLIPAHAGKTAASIRERTGKRAHPRSRGENRPRRRQVHRRTGSSPLTRGKPLARSQRHLHVGLIPAHAGKTVKFMGLGPISWAHPRSRGENGPGGRHAGSRAGSSPLTRGKRRGREAGHRRRRLIPAHAGKTASR